MKKCFLLVALVFVMVAAGVAWEIRAASAAPPAKRIKLVMMQPRDTFGGGLVCEGTMTSRNPAGASVAVNVLEPLTGYNKDGPVPMLALKWQQSPDATRWRYYLRKGVKFHNGADFTSRDVVESVKWTIRNKKLSQNYQGMPFKDAVALDDYTVDIFFEEPQPLHLINWHFMLIGPSSTTRDNPELYKTNPIGTGPYRFVEWKTGAYTKLTKFEGYWGPKPQIDDIEIISRPEEGVRLAALMAREVDWVYAISPESAMVAPRVARMPSPDTVWIRFDGYIQKELGRESLLADKRLRLAVEYAIDRQALVTLYNGLVTPSLGQLASPGDFGFDPQLKSRPYDLEKARALVREASAVGKTLSLVAPTDRFAKDREAAEAIGFMIEKTGLKVKMMLMPYNEVKKYQQVTGPERAFMSDMTLTATDALFQTETRFGKLFSEGSREYAFTDMEPSRLFKEAVHESDFVKREEKLRKAWGYVYEQAYYVPVYKPEWLWGISKNLEWKVDVLGRPYVPDMRFTD